MECFRTDGPVSIVDQAEAAQRWPRFVAALQGPTAGLRHHDQIRLASRDSWPLVVFQRVCRRPPPPTSARCEPAQAPPDTRRRDAHPARAAASFPLQHPVFSSCWLQSPPAAPTHG